MKSRSVVTVVALALAGGMFVTACSSTPAASTSTTSGSKAPFKVAAILELTGTYSEFGIAGQQALETEVATINKTGGILGRQVQVTYLDNQSSPTQASSLAEQAIDSGQYQALVAGSTQLTAMVSSFNDKPVLEFSTGTLPVVSLAKNPTFFVTVPSLYPSPVAMASYIVNSLHAKSVGIVYGQDSAGAPDLAAYQYAFGAAGVTVTSEAVSDTSVDVTSQLNVLQAAHPDVLIDSTYGPVTGHVAVGLHDINWNVPVVGDLLASASNVATLVPSTSYVSNWKLLYFSSLVRKGSSAPPQVAQFINAIQAKYGTIMASVNTYTETGDVLLLTQYAFDKAGSLNATKAAHALEAIQSDPAASNVKFLTTTKYGYSPTSAYSFSVNAEEQGATNSYFEMASASAPQVDGTLEFAATIPNGPVKIKSTGQ